MKNLFIILLSCAVCVGCQKVDLNMVNAQKYEQSGMLKEAFESYYASYSVDRNAEAHIALRDCANQLVNRDIARAQSFKMAGNFEEARKVIVEVEDFAYRQQWLGIDSQSQIGIRKKEITKALVEDYFQRAEIAVKEERFDDAKVYLKSIGRYDKNHEPSVYLNRLIEIIPLYRKGVQAFELGLFKESFDFMQQVVNVDANYEDALVIMSDARVRSEFNLGVVVKDSKYINSEFQSVLSASMKKRIIDLDNPLVKLVESQDLGHLLEQQQQSMSAGFSDEGVIQAGQLEGAEYILFCEVLDYECSSPAVKKVLKQGYAGPSIRSLKTNYYEFHETRSVSFIIKFELINAESGEIKLVENIPCSKTVSNHYALSDVDNVYPGVWEWKNLKSTSDRVYSDAASVSKLRELQNNQGKLQGELEMRFTCAENVTNQMTESLKVFYESNFR